MLDELILELLPGFHSLQSTISINDQHTTTFIMKGSNVTIQCIGSSGFFSMEFPYVWFVKIGAINFYNCGGADIYHVNSLVVENCNIFNLQKSWSLEMVSNATIMGSWFLNGQVRPVLLVERSSVLIKHSMFVNTTIAYGGGYTYCEGAAIYSEFSVLNIEHSNFLRNRADCVLIFSAIGGAIYAFVTNVSITDSTFVENSALHSGGAIYINDGSLKILNSFFGYNSADRGTGGALHVYAIFNSVSICDSRFLNNSADFIFEGSGSAIYVEGRGANNISLIDTSFNENSADSCGALRIMNFNSYHTVSIINSNFVHNAESRRTEVATIVTAYTQFGGVACINGSVIYIIDSNFTENQAAGHAGVLHVENSTLLIKRSIFSGNRVQCNGGVIFTMLSSVAIAIERSSFTYNQAGGDGGVIYIRSVGKSGSSQVIAEESMFGFNNATKRGGVIAITGGQVGIEKSQFYNNTAELGGVISACISEIKVQMKLRVMDDPSNPQLCTLYDTGKKFVSPIAFGSARDNLVSTLHTTLGIAVTLCVVCFLLCVVITCIVLYLCGIFKYCKCNCKRGGACSNVDNAHYDSIN